MNRIIETFGRAVDGRIGKNPAAARALLTAGFRLNSWAGRNFIRKTSPARLYLADASTRAIVNGLDVSRESAMVSLFTPCELLQAFGLTPMFPEGLSCYLAGAGAERGFIDFAEKAGIPETFCSYHKVLIGAAESGVLPKPRFIFNTTLACDANTLTFRRLAEHYGVPHFVIDVPFAQDARAAADVAEQLRQTARGIAKLTGRRLDEEKLRQAVARSERTLELYRKYLAERAKKSMPDEMTSEMYAMFALHVLLGTPEAEAFAQKLLAEAQAAPPAGDELRLLWAHTLPMLDGAMIGLLDFNRQCQILADDLCFDAPPVHAPDDPWDAMAQRLVRNHFNGPAQRRVDAVLHQAEAMRADGVVWFCHWGCRQTAGAGQLAKARLEAAGFPTLVLDGDGCDRANCPPGQMVTRVQAFLELLEERHDRIHL